jgi:hypothetical protein
MSTFERVRHLTHLGRLSDDDLLQICREVYREGRELSFVLVYAEALLLATRRDFMLLRPFTLILIGKYNLVRYLYLQSAGEEEQRSA